MIQRVLKKTGLFKMLNLNFSRMVNTTRFIIPLINGIGESHLYPSEEWKISVLGRLTKLKKGLFVDVGVNIGQTLLKLKSVDADYPYIGFEPNPSCVNYLKILVRRNHLKNTSIIPVALGNKNELLELNFHFGEDEESASLLAAFRPLQPVISKEFVPVLDFETIRPVLTQLASILKIDVEGFELEVIQGLSVLIDKDKPYIICEILPVYSPENKDRLRRQVEIQNILREKDYSMFRILENGSLVELDDIGIHSEIPLSYYLFAHKKDCHSLKEVFAPVIRQTSLIS
jgi:FkbM family methyltransferase